MMGTFIWLLCGQVISLLLYTPCKVITLLMTLQTPLYCGGRSYTYGVFGTPNNELLYYITIMTCPILWVTNGS